MRAATSTPSPSPSIRTRQVTVYRVLKDGEVVSEFADLASARAEAVKAIGRIQVAVKTIEV